MTCARQLSWREFRDRAPPATGERPPYYRGHASSSWNLLPSLFRDERLPTLAHYLEEVVPQVHEAVSGYLDVTLDLSRSRDLDRFLAILRRYDFPSPLLDWTLSPLVAAFFAFDAVRSTRSTHAAIWQLDTEASTFERLNLEVISAHPADNPVLVAQHGVHTRFLTEHALEPSPTLDGREECVLTRFDLPTTDARAALDDLAAAGIDAASLFPAGGAVCERLEQELSIEGRRLFQPQK